MCEAIQVNSGNDSPFEDEGHNTAAIPRIIYMQRCVCFIPMSIYNNAHSEVTDTNALLQFTGFVTRNAKNHLENMRFPSPSCLRPDVTVTTSGS